MNIEKGKAIATPTNHLFSAASYSHLDFCYICMDRLILRLWSQGKPSLLKSSWGQWWWGYVNNVFFKKSFLLACPLTCKYFSSNIRCGFGLVIFLSIPSACMNSPFLFIFSVPLGDNWVLKTNPYQYQYPAVQMRRVKIKSNMVPIL